MGLLMLSWNELTNEHNSNVSHPGFHDNWFTMHIRQHWNFQTVALSSKTVYPHTTFFRPLSPPMLYFLQNGMRHESFHIAIFFKLIVWSNNHLVTTHLLPPVDMLVLTPPPPPPHPHPHHPHPHPTPTPFTQLMFNKYTDIFRYFVNTY